MTNYSGINSHNQLEPPEKEENIIDLSGCLSHLNVNGRDERPSSETSTKHNLSHIALDEDPPTQTKLKEKSYPHKNHANRSHVQHIICMPNLSLKVRGNHTISPSI